MKKIIFLLMTGLIFLLSACRKAVEPNPIYQTITAAEAHAMMQNSDNYILLDVRTEEEFYEKRIKGSILIPDYEIKDRAEAELPDKNAIILVYCLSGRRSAGAARILSELGYTNVFNFGGIIDWPYDTIAQ